MTAQPRDFFGNVAPVSQDSGFLSQTTFVNLNAVID